jgi:hypothetical protein
MKTIITYQQRKNIRFPDYDYSAPGRYFITICVKDRIRSFGEIQDKKMKLNDIGDIAYEYWNNIPVHFPDVILHEFIIMPDHIHGIIEIRKDPQEKRSRHVVTVPNANDRDNAGASHVMPVSLLFINKNKFIIPKWIFLHLKKTI